MPKFCSQTSVDNDSPLYGTAANAKVWIMLEYSGRWAARALGDNDLPDRVNAWLSAQADAIPESRVVFIKQDSYQPQDTLYIARADADGQVLYRVRFESFEALVAVDVAGVLAGDVSAEIVTDPIVLVCTNGKRDQCCAKFGLPTYQALAQKMGRNVWQVTHIGGHRYAPTLAVFPAGIYYGHIFVEQTDALVEAVTNRQVLLPHYRGRVFQSGPINAADYWLRKEAGEFAEDGLRVEGIAEGNSAEIQTIQFSDTANAIHSLTIEAGKTEPELASCNKLKYKPAPHYTLLNYSTSEPSRSSVISAE